MSTTDAVRLTSDQITAEILPLGASIRRLDVRLADNSWRNIALGYHRESGYQTAIGKLGMSIGRYANRIGGARITLDGIEYALTANQGPHQLHGGPGGFHTRVWTVIGSGPHWVELELHSPDGDQGFPGDLTVTARYDIVPGGLQVTYRATTSAPTVINLTTHPYFNLDGEGSGNTDKHTVLIGASTYLPTDDDGIPTGEIRSVTGSAVDFRAGSQLGPAREAAVDEGIAKKGGFDHTLVIDGNGMREHCRLTGEDGLTLVVESDQPALQVYSGSHFDGTPGTSGRPYPTRAGLALETQNLPDAPNQPAFPNTVLRPGDEYQATTRWRIAEETAAGHTAAQH